jgi:hypothetical protein
MLTPRQAAFKRAGIWAMALAAGVQAAEAEVKKARAEGLYDSKSGTAYSHMRGFFSSWYYGTVGVVQGSYEGAYATSKANIQKGILEMEDAIRRGKDPSPWLASLKMAARDLYTLTGTESAVGGCIELKDDVKAITEEELANARQRQQNLGAQEAINDSLARCNYTDALATIRRLQDNKDQPSWLPTILPNIEKGAAAQASVDAFLTRATATTDAKQKEELLNKAAAAAGSSPCLTQRVQRARPARPGEKCSVYSLNLSGPSIWVETETERLQSQASRYDGGGDGKAPPAVLATLGTYTDCEAAKAAWCQMSKGQPARPRPGTGGSQVQVGGTWYWLGNDPGCRANTTTALSDVATPPVAALQQKVLPPVNPPRLLAPPVLPPSVVHVNPPANTYPGPTTIIDHNLRKPPELLPPRSALSATLPPPIPPPVIIHRPATLPLPIPPRVATAPVHQTPNINVYTPPTPHVERQTHINVYKPPVQPQTHVNIYIPPVQPQHHVNVYTPASKGSGSTSSTGHVNSAPLSSGRINVTPRAGGPVRTVAVAKPLFRFSQRSSARR